MKTSMKTVVLLAALGGVALSAQAQRITVKGSDTLVVLAQKWAETYMAKNPKVKIQVTGGGSGTGIAALQNKTTTICNSSRKIRGDEIAVCIQAFGRRPIEHKVALDGLTVYLHESNPIKELTMQELQGIFTGKIKNWNEVGGPDARIQVYSRENSSGTYEFFKEVVLKNMDYTAAAKTIPGTAGVVQAVAKDKFGIGYGGAAYGKGAKHIAVKRDANSPAIEPTLERVVNGTYPIWRYLYCLLDPALEKGEVLNYINWILSDEGQALVAEVGYFPLPKHLRE